MTYNLSSMKRLVEVLRSLPGIGPRMAERLSFHILKMSPEETNAITEAIREVKNKIRYCSLCYNITEDEVCQLCRDPKRNKSLICVVEKPHDIVAIEKTGEYKGRYHVLMGALSPLDDVGPEDIRIKDLIERIKKEHVSEVIIATNPNVQGETTATYLVGLIKPLGIKVSRLAYGISMGSALEYTDEMTLGRAIEGRREL